MTDWRANLDRIYSDFDSLEKANHIEATEIINLSTRLLKYFGDHDCFNDIKILLPKIAKEEYPFLLAQLPAELSHLVAEHLTKLK